MQIFTTTSIYLLLSLLPTSSIASNPSSKSLSFQEFHGSHYSPIESESDGGDTWSFAEATSLKGDEILATDKGTAPFKISEAVSFVGAAMNNLKYSKIHNDDRFHYFGVEPYSFVSVTLETEGDKALLLESHGSVIEVVRDGRKIVSASKELLETRLVYQSGSNVTTRKVSLQSGDSILIIMTLCKNRTISRFNRKLKSILESIGDISLSSAATNLQNALQFEDYVIASILKVN